MAAMTFMTVTYELQKPLAPEQYRALGNFREYLRFAALPL